MTNIAKSNVTTRSKVRGHSVLTLMDGVNTWSHDLALIQDIERRTKRLFNSKL